MEKQLLIETTLFIATPESLNESIKDPNGKMIVEGLIQMADTKNGNGRVYALEILKREADKYLQGPIKERRALGELDHPDSPIINLKNVSHNVINLYWKDKGKLAWRVNFPVLEREMTEILSALPFHEVMIPTLFVRGELSNYIEDQDFEQIESYFPDSQIETVANSGHWVHAEAPEDFFEVVLGFCIR